VTARTPADGAVGVPVGTPVTATFGEAIDPATVDGSTFELRPGAGAPVAATVSYDPGSRVARLTPSGPLAAGVTYTARLRGGAAEPRVEDLAGNALAADVVWSFTTIVPDTTAPTVTARVPAAGATGVATTATVNVTFDEALDPATVSTATFELRDAGAVLVPATVSWNAATRVATLRPSAPLAAASTYTVTVLGGPTEPRVRDVAGNALAANATWSFVTAAGPSCPCSAWDATTTPSVAVANDPGAVELGVKFRPLSSGFVTGVRFYKGGPANGGTHVGSLWSTAGSLLARATFTNETASGWQTVTFATPVAVTAGTTYVVSYHAPQGGYSIDTNFFATAGVSNGPVELPSSSASGGNGVYRYGATPGFPSSSWNASNYWVDVVFTP
jgi:hypothetical protein